MRINRLKIANWESVSSFEAQFDESDNIICIIDTRDNPCGDDLPTIFKKIFFETFKSDGIFGENAKIECECTRDNAQVYLEFKGIPQEKEILYNGQKMKGFIHGIEETCYCSANASEQIKQMMSFDFREALYPPELRDFAFFNGRIPCGLEKLMSAVDTDWLEFRHLTDKERIVFDEKYTLKINVDGECILEDGYSMAMDMQDRFTGGEYNRLRFLEWLVTLNLAKSLCEHIDREGDFPVFVDGLFDKLQKGKNNALLFDQMRKTGRQVFIFLYKRDDEIEKYCDKVIEVESIK